MLLIGADPPFSILVAPVVRKLLPDIRIVHWCFDLHPEYAIADGMFRAGQLGHPGAESPAAQGLCFL